MQEINSVLIDRNNLESTLPLLVQKISAATLIGFDTETQDVTTAHPGIVAFRGKDTGSAFDWRRMIVVGFSMYFNGDDTAYYFNLNHADVENRLRWEEVKPIFDAKKPGASWVAHNAPFELVVMANNFQFEMPDMICTMQMAVSAWGGDEYNHEEYISARFGEIAGLFPDIEKAFRNYNVYEKEMDDETGKEKLSPLQADLISKILAKNSDAGHSYSGFIRTISYGYGLKKIVKKFFDYDMVTFDQVLGTRAHMGELTGREVVEYGCDDAYWAVKLFYRIYQYMKENCPETIPTFFSQENPMIHVFSDIRREGWRINLQAVSDRTDLERQCFSAELRKLKTTIQGLLPFPSEPNERLMKYETWYNGLDKKGAPAKSGKNYQFYRQRFEEWAKTPNYDDDKKQAAQISSAVSNAWLGKENTGAMNLGHYFQSRLMMYDLARMPAIIYKGKVQSDGETRGELKDKIKKKIAELPDSGGHPDPLKDHYTTALKMVDVLNEMASIEQRMKLYLTPYSKLTDPETTRMYPEISSMLATRRMASANPNSMQLSKRGASTYVRGFFLPDQEDHVLVSLDWSQIELVLVGEFSGDPEFAKAYGQLPYQDLHTGACAEVLSVTIPEVTEHMIRNMHKMTPEELPAKLLIKPNGESLTPSNAKKFWRTEVGKASNFNYWYSGALSTVGEKLGWTSDQMWKATEKYRKRFAVAEAWRTGTIDQARWTGHVMLPDGHRRNRWEITHDWTNITQRMFEGYGLPGLKNFAAVFIKQIRSRAGNQLVNALIQGSCATLAKRSILSISEELKKTSLRVAFKSPIHDELVFSVHKDDVVEFLRLARRVMCNHPEIIKNLKIDCTASVGITFEPFVKDKVTLGQIELDECPDILGFEEGSKLTEEQTQQVVDYLFKQKEVISRKV